MGCTPFYKKISKEERRIDFRKMSLFYSINRHARLIKINLVRVKTNKNR